MLTTGVMVTVGLSGLAITIGLLSLIGVGIGEFVLAVLVTQMDGFRHLLGTTQLTMHEFAWTLIPAIALLLLWKLGKLAARRRAGPPAAEVV